MLNAECTVLSYAQNVKRSFSFVPSLARSCAAAAMAAYMFSWNPLRYMAGFKTSTVILVACTRENFCSRQFICLAGCACDLVSHHFFSKCRWSRLLFMQRALFHGKHSAFWSAFYMSWDSQEFADTQVKLRAAVTHEWRVVHADRAWRERNF